MASETETETKAYRVMGLYYETIEKAEDAAVKESWKLKSQIDVFVGDTQMVRSIVSYYSAGYGAAYVSVQTAY